MIQTLLGASEIPSPTSSPWIRLYPHVGFSAAKRRISCRACAASGGRYQENAIGRSQARPTDLTPEHLQLMPKHEDLHFLRTLVPTEQNE
jgi:hypothetical protein